MIGVWTGVLTGGRWAFSGVQMDYKAKYHQDIIYRCEALAHIKSILREQARYMPPYYLRCSTAWTSTTLST
jgi:hypothetical protein